MKSLMFRNNTQELSEVFKKDIERLSKLELQVLKYLPNIVIESSQVTTATEKNKIIDSAAKKLEIDRSVIVNNVSIIRHFLTNLTPGEDEFQDEPEALANDLVELNYVSKASLEVLIAFFKEVKSVTETTYSKLQEGIYKRGILPRFTGIGTTIDYRVVFEKEHEFGENLEAYTPDCKGIIPIVSVRLILSDESPNKYVHFQLDDERIQLLIDALQAAQKQTKEANKFLNLQ